MKQITEICNGICIYADNTGFSGRVIQNLVGANGGG